LDIDIWVERYGQAWREKDDEAVAALFTEGATYASHPLQAPHQGRDGIRAYWRRATADQEDLDLCFGEPVVSEDGRRAAVEWWVTMRDGDWAARQGAEDDRLTLPGCLVLRFAADGLCEELREYWNVGFGPPAHPSKGWGG
jgi:ketosteroid isomerase-like protein